MSYHLTNIAKGVLGELSKIQEEVDEIKDAQAQNCKIMVHAELADLYGAVEAFAKNHNLTMDDLRIMNEATKRAFASGRRTSDDVVSTIPKDMDVKNITRFGYIAPEYNPNDNQVTLIHASEANRRANESNQIIDHWKNELVSSKGISNADADNIILNENLIANESFEQVDGFIVDKNKHQVGYRVKTYLGLIYFIQFTDITNTIVYIPNTKKEKQMIQLNKHFTNVKEWTRVFNLKGDIKVCKTNDLLLNCSNQLYKCTAGESKFEQMHLDTAYPIGNNNVFLLASSDCALLVNSEHYFDSIFERNKVLVTEDLHKSIMDIYNNCKILDDNDNDNLNQRVEVL